MNGESISDLHDRTAYALQRIIEDCDRSGVKAIVLCTHAATLIAIGRVLTGRMPEDVEEEDFRPFTCSLSTFTRRSFSTSETPKWSGKDGDVPRVPWRDGQGVGGGWNLDISGDCSFLSGGEERGWYFQRFRTERYNLLIHLIGDFLETNRSAHRRLQRGLLLMPELGWASSLRENKRSVPFLIAAVLHDCKFTLKSRR